MFRLMFQLTFDNWWKSISINISYRRIQPTHFRPISSNIYSFKLFPARLAIPIDFNRYFAQILLIGRKFISRVASFNQSINHQTESSTYEYSVGTLR